MTEKHLVSQNAQSNKVKVTLSIDNEMRNYARENDLNMSAVLENTLYSLRFENHNTIIPCHNQMRASNREQNQQNQNPTDFNPEIVPLNQYVSEEYDTTVFRTQIKRNKAFKLIFERIFNAMKINSEFLTEINANEGLIITVIKNIVMNYLEEEEENVNITVNKNSNFKVHQQDKTIDVYHANGKVTQEYEPEFVKSEISRLNDLLVEYTNAQTKRNFKSIADSYKLHEQEFKHYILNIRQLKMSTYQRIVYTLKSLTKIYTTDDIDNFKKYYNHNIDGNQKSAIKKYLSFLKLHQKLKYFNGIEINEWIEHVSEAKNKTHSEINRQHRVRTLTSEEIAEFFDSQIEYDRKITLFAFYAGMRITQVINFLQLPKERKQIVYEDDELVVFDAKDIQSGTKSLNYIFIPKCVKSYALKQLKFPPPRKNKGKCIKGMNSFNYRIRRVINGKKIGGNTMRKLHANILKNLKAPKEIVSLLESREEDLQVIDKCYYDREEELQEWAKKGFNEMLKIYSWSNCE